MNNQQNNSESQQPTDSVQGTDNNQQQRAEERAESYVAHTSTNYHNMPQETTSYENQLNQERFTVYRGSNVGAYPSTSSRSMTQGPSNTETTTGNIDLQKILQENRRLKSLVEAGQNPKKRNPNKTYVEEANRRLNLVSHNNGDLYKMFQLLADEVRDQFPEIFTRTLEQVCGNNWPDTKTACVRYNVAECHSFHIHRGEKDGKCYLHVCGICLRLHRVGLYHPAKDCKSLGFLDNRMIKAQIENRLQSSI